MKATLIILLTLGTMLARGEDPRKVLSFPANTGVVIVRNEFARLNPAYKQRAGSFYEVTHLGKATERLITAAKLADLQKPAAFEIVRAFIYDWLDVYVRNNGHMSPANLRETIASMDGRFEQLLSPEQFKEYLGWREDRSRNELAFLIHYSEPARKEPAMPSDLK